MSRRAWLIGIAEDGAQGRWVLVEDTFVIGRKPPAHLVFDFPRISRRHAQIVYHNFAYTITDLGSRNGTYLNGKVVGSVPVKLVGGDEIVIGGVIALRFNDPDETAAGPRIGRITGVWIDPNTQRVFVDSEEMEPPLSPAQLTLLKLLYVSADAIVSRDQIITAVWPDADPRGVSGEAVDGLIKRLRKRFRQIQPNREYIQVIRGHGLRLNQPKISHH